jgi:F-type H+-transporting ATPase subunit delta
MAKLISKTYGDALLSVAVEEDKIDSFAEEIAALENVLQDNPDFDRLINNPRVAMEDKVKVVENVFKGHLSDEIIGFMTMIVSKGRFTQIHEILQYFTDQVKKLKGIGVAYVTTPKELTESQKKDVVNKLTDTAGFKTMEMHYEVKPELIGGMQIRIGDRVVDSSVSTKITKMQQGLMKIQLADNQN